MGSFTLVYLTVYNHFYSHFYNVKTKEKVGKFNFAASTANTVISVSIIFACNYIYKSLTGDLKKTDKALIYVLSGVVYYLLYLIFQRNRDLTFLYKNYLNLPAYKRRNWKIITVVIFILCFLTGLIPSVKNI